MPDRDADGNTRIIVVEAGRNTVGMMVDSVTEVKYINGGQIEPFSGLISSDERHSCILGVCKLKDQLLILVDLQKALCGVVDVGKAGEAAEPLKTA
jgi:purine-binding chemotaxis protein CheW